MSAIRRNQLADLHKCPCGGVTLDKLVRPAALTVLAGAELHGYAVLQRIAEMPMFRGEAPDAAGLYRTLRALAREGMLSCAWDVSGSGPAKRSYRITQRGRACLAAWVETLEQYGRGIAQLLRAARRADKAGAPPRGKRCCRSGGRTARTRPPRDASKACRRKGTEP